MVLEKQCLICQDFEDNVGHETLWCPNNPCKKCGKTGHTKLDCMVHMENLPLPNEIVFQIISYLSITDLGHCAQVSKRLRDISTSQINKEKTDDGFLKRLKKTPNLKLSDAEMLFWSWTYLSDRHLSKDIIKQAGNKVTLIVKKSSSSKNGSDLILVELLKVSPK